MNNIVTVVLDNPTYATAPQIYQYNYGQILRIQGGAFPKAVEVHFSIQEKSGDSITRIGTTADGVTEVPIPELMLENYDSIENYDFWAYIYVEDGTSGTTECKIRIPVKARSKPEVPGTPEEPELFRETVKAVNDAADRAEIAEQNAKASATEAGKYAASASESAVAAEKTKEDALRKIGEKKQEAIEAIQEQKETSVGKITTHTDDEIQRILNQTAGSKRELEQTITNAGVSKEELDESIQTAGDTKTALDKSTELAGTAKTELDTSTQKAGEAKTALDGSAKTAGEMQETLSATVKQAGVLDTSLSEKIKTGTQLNEDLTASVEKAVQDIQAAGSEQLGKMQAVAEEFTADREQITTNKEDIGSLKEDLSNKITKFYASNQGETHLADSDNGKIMDMMLYGMSEQKQYRGKNLLKIRDAVQTTRGVTVTAKDGVVALKGTATETGWAILDVDSFVLDGTYILSSNVTGPGVKLANKSCKAVLEQNKSKTLENEEVSKVCFVVTSGKTYDVSNILVQIEKGSEATSYEPYVGGQPSPSPDYPQEIKNVVNPTIKLSNEDGTESQSVTLPYTLNAIPVSSGGNVTIDGKQYIADYVDVERGKYVQMIQTDQVQSNIKWTIQKQKKGYSLGYASIYKSGIPTKKPGMGKAWKSNIGDSSGAWSNGFSFGRGTVFWIVPYENDGNITSDDINAWLVEHPMDIMYPLAEPIETDLTPEENEAFKALVTNYPGTNISVTSDQLDGYTVFNYPISMANGWNYVKQQLNDNRDYIYDMDLQSAEAYVNSEYAVALTELEVM